MKSLDAFFAWFARNAPPEVILIVLLAVILIALLM